MLESQYLDKVIRKFDQTPPQEEQFRQAASIVTDGVLRGGKVWVYDREEALSCDANVRASGLFMTSNVYTKDEHLSPEDILIIGAVEPDNPEDIAIAVKVRSEGAKVIAITATSVTGRPSGGTFLKDTVDIVLDNHSPEVVGILSAGGMKSAFCPTSGVMNDIIFWALCAAIIDEFFRRGKTPTVYRGVHLFYGREYNRRAAERYKELGY